MRLKFAAITTLIAALSASSQAFGASHLHDRTSSRCCPGAQSRTSLSRGKRCKAHAEDGWRPARDIFHG